MDGKIEPLRTIGMEHRTADNHCGVRWVGVGTESANTSVVNPRAAVSALDTQVWWGVQDSAFIHPDIHPYLHGASA